MPPSFDSVWKVCEAFCRAITSREKRGRIMTSWTLLEVNWTPENFSIFGPKNRLFGPLYIGVLGPLHFWTFG